MGTWREVLARVEPGIFKWTGVAMLVALPVFLITFNVQVMFNAPWVYSTGFQRNDIPERSGVPLEELDRVGSEIREYFNNDQEYMFIFLYGQPLFTAREVEHMRDVKALLRLVYTVMVVSGAVLLAYSAWGYGREGLRFLRRTKTAGLVSTVGVVVAGIVLGLGFPVFFTLFHEISFSNDYWILSPSEHFLVVMFPYRFWLEATLLLAFATVAELLAVWGVSRFTLRRLAARDDAAAATAE